LLIAGQHAEALGALDRAIAISEAQGERFYAAETRRMKGQALARSGDVAGAQRCVNEAAEIARRQQATLFELRNAQIAGGGAVTK
jgi:tetratricopeptide (TPR) repeat protein